MYGYYYLLLVFLIFWRDFMYFLQVLVNTANLAATTRDWTVDLRP